MRYLYFTAGINFIHDDNLLLQLTNKTNQKSIWRLVVQWIGICLPVQWMLRFQILIKGEKAPHVIEATKSVHHHTTELVL